MTNTMSDYVVGERISCGCCRGPEGSDRCCCWMHQDTPRGILPKVCEKHKELATAHQPYRGTKWRVDAENYSGVVLVDVVDATNDCVAEVKDLALAQYIVRACNAHTEMLSALRLVAMATVPICAEGHGPQCDCVGDLVRAAIQWAETDR